MTNSRVLEHLAPPNIPVSWGELIDKITILELKRQNIRDPEASQGIARELGLLRAHLGPVEADAKVAALTEALRTVNAKLWDIEDRIREKEAAREFDDQFIDLARSVYLTNDERAKIKREINDCLSSNLKEYKSYSEYET